MTKQKNKSNEATDESLSTPGAAALSPTRSNTTGPTTPRRGPHPIQPPCPKQPGHPIQPMRLDMPMILPTIKDRTTNNRRTAMDCLKTTKDQTAMDKSRSSSATSATPPTHMPGSTTPRHGHRGLCPIQPTCPRTMLTNEDPTVVGPTTMIPPALILHEDPTAVGPTTTIPPNLIVHDPTQHKHTMDRSTTKDKTMLE